MIAQNGDEKIALVERNISSTAARRIVPMGNSFDVSQLNFQELSQIYADGENLESTLDAVQQALSQQRKCRADNDITLEASLLLGRYLQNLLFRKGKKSLADHAAKCYQNALELDPANPIALSCLAIVRYMQYECLGERWILDEAIDLACEWFNTSPQRAQSLATVSSLFLCLWRPELTWMDAWMIWR